MAGELISKEITYCGQKVTLACDGKCDKAFGIDLRETSPNSLDENDFEYMADGELPDAPEDTGVYEGGHAKPLNAAIDGQNKWCARQCERSVLVPLGEVIVLPDFSKRVSNIRTTSEPTPQFPQQSSPGFHIQFEVDTSIGELPVNEIPRDNMAPQYPGSYHHYPNEFYY